MSIENDHTTEEAEYNHLSHRALLSRSAAALAVGVVSFIGIAEVAQVIDRVSSSSPTYTDHNPYVQLNGRTGHDN